MVGHFRDCRGMEKKLNLTQQWHAFTNQKMHYNTKQTQKNEARFVDFYDIWPGNGVGLFSKKKDK